MPLGQSGYNATVAAVGGEVIVTLEATYGTLIIIR